MFRRTADDNRERGDHKTHLSLLPINGVESGGLDLHEEISLAGLGLGEILGELQVLKRRSSLGENDSFHYDWY